MCVCMSSFFFPSRRRHTRWPRDWSSDVCSSDLAQEPRLTEGAQMNEGVVSAELGLTGWPAVAEESIIARDVLLAEHEIGRASCRERVEIAGEAGSGEKETT